jgi:hypothetical protein
MAEALPQAAEGKGISREAPADSPFKGMTDSQVAMPAKAHLERGAAMPPDSLGQIAAGLRYDRCQAKLGRVCRRCSEPVTVTGHPEWGPAVHAGTGDELGRDGHLVAPISGDILRAAAARKAGAGS